MGQENVDDTRLYLSDEAAARAKTDQDREEALATSPDLAPIVLSCSRVPRLGRSLRSRRFAMASRAWTRHPLARIRRLSEGRTGPGRVSRRQDPDGIPMSFGVVLGLCEVKACLAGG